MNDDITQYDTGCSCDGTCTDCSQEMRADLDTVLAVLARVADALAGRGGPRI